MLVYDYFRVLAALLLPLWLLLITQPHVTQTLPDIIRIGGLFDRGDLRQEVAFQYAVERVNSVRSSFRKSRSRLQPVIEQIPPYDSFHASKRVCHLLRSGVAAIFGPQSGQTSAHVQSICDALEVPHIETRWDYRMRRDDYSVNLYPHPSSLSKAYLDLVRLFGWTSFCILYEDNEGLIRLQELLKTPSPQEFKISIRQLDRGSDFRPTLRDIKRLGESNILLDCQTDKIVEVLKQAQQIGMMTPYNNYIITSLDTHLLDLEDFKYGGSNITAVRLLDNTKPAVAHIMRELAAGMARYINREQDYQLKMGVRSHAISWGGEDLRDHQMGTETALMYDAVHLFVLAIQALDNSTDVQVAPLVCEGEEAWLHGNSLINYMKLVNMTGLTGHIEFDSLGFRTNFDLDVVELDLQGFVPAGSWNLLQGANYTRTYQEVHDQAIRGLKNKTLIVSFAFTDPYIMRKKSAHRLTGNDRFEGFCVSLLDEISARLGFNYTLVPIKDNVYGSKNPVTGEWNGMIRELLTQRADMAITDLTINYEREQAVDFTMPFMNLGISIIYKKPQKMAPSLFSFLSPLSVEVWIYMITAYVGVSMILYILARFTPYEWQNPHPCDPEPESLENQFTMLNCMWFAIGSLMQQGCDFLPQAVSTRMVAGMWWFFTLIMISSYTANLAAFLTVERMDSPIESAEDLSKQTKIKYGAYKSGSTAAFFRDSALPTYQRMWQYMNSTPDVFVNSNAEGFQRVQSKDELYAFLSESTSIEYVTERFCDLVQIGGLLDSKSYGIALPPGSPHKDALDVAILGLQESGRLFIMKQLWWKEKHGGGKCKEEASAGGMASELNLSNVGGVFVVLIGGMGLALVVAIFEFLGECVNISKDDEIPLMDVLRQELRFVLKCKGSTKPIRKKSSENGDVDDLDDEDEHEETIYGGSEVYTYGNKTPIT